MAADQLTQTLGVDPATGLSDDEEHMERLSVPATNSAWSHHGAYIWGLTKWAGKVSGAHINPSVTWTYFRLGWQNFTDAHLNTVAQFVGAVPAAQWLTYLFDDLFAHPSVNFEIAQPKPPYGATVAFVADFIISFGLMGMNLFVGSSRRLKPHLPLLTSGLIAVYLVVEVSFLDMSLNSARSFAGALAGHNWTGFISSPRQSRCYWQPGCFCGGKLSEYGPFFFADTDI